ncbi:nuclear transport factor 2 family protein [Levilactobacillus senmaizukei]|nr:nuclear transport factor 2 family protein [Levilactobacillus senmaizukei]
METMILQLYRDYNAAMAVDDVRVLDKLLATDFTLTHMTGYVQPRQEWLAEMSAGTMRYFTSVEERVTVTKTATGWQVVGDNQVAASIHGSGRHTWPLRTVLTIERQTGPWKIQRAVVTMY